MNEIRDEFHREHHSLMPHIDFIRTTADAVGEVEPETLRAMIEEVYEFLSKTLIPHAAMEDRVVYPVVADVLGTSHATATMTHDHAEIEKLTDELGVLRVEVALEGSTLEALHTLRETLYGLYAIVRLHIAKEEEIFVPLLEQRLSDRGHQRMLAAMRAHELPQHV